MEYKYQNRFNVQYFVIEGGGKERLHFLSGLQDGLEHGRAVAAGEDGSITETLHKQRHANA